MTTPRTIGILGGMGPEATVLLMQKLIQAVPAQDDADHIPLIVDNNTQVPSRIRAIIEGTGEDPAPVLRAMARRLEAAGAEALAMPCNTAHHYAEAIASAVQVPFFNMVELAAQSARDEFGAGAVGLLGSPALRKVGVFDAAFALRSLSTLWPSDEGAMLDTIRRVKREGPVPGALEVLNAAAAELAGRGASGVLVACTEFSLLAGRIESQVPVIDTLDVLVRRCVGFALEGMQPATGSGTQTSAAGSTSPVTSRRASDSR